MLRERNSSLVPKYVPSDLLQLSVVGGKRKKRERGKKRAQGVEELNLTFANIKMFDLYRALVLHYPFTNVSPQSVGLRLRQ